MNLISKKLISFKLFAPIFGLALGLAVLPGCGYDEGDLCDDTCNCVGCSDAEYEDCVDNSEDLARDVEFEGCEDFYDDYLDCVGEEFSCRDGQVDLDGCGNEFGRLNNCLF